MVFVAADNLTEPITVTAMEMGSAFIHAARYLSQSPRVPNEKYLNMSLDERMEDAAEYWGNHFNMKVIYCRESQDFTFIFKNKSEYVLFMLEWS
jgi:hypothetical protein